MRTAGTLLGYQVVERAAHVVGRELRDVGTVRAEEHDVQRTFLVPEKRLPGAFTVDAHALRPQHVLDGPRVTAAQPERCEEPERDGVAVSELEVRRRLERVRERVP